MRGTLTPQRVIVEYKGKQTQYATVIVDNKDYTIKVEINDEFIPVKDIKVDGVSIVDRKEANISLKEFIKDIDFNEETGILTFTKEDNSIIEIDLPTEKIIKSGHYDNNNKDIVLILENDEEIRIPVEDLTSDIIKIDGEGDKFLNDQGQYVEITGGSGGTFEIEEGF